MNRISVGSVISSLFAALEKCQCLLRSRVLCHLDRQSVLCPKFILLFFCVCTDSLSQAAQKLRIRKRIVELKLKIYVLNRNHEFTF